MIISHTVTFDGNDHISTIMGTDIRPQVFSYSISPDTWGTEHSLHAMATYFYHWKPFFDGGQNVYAIAGRDYGSLDKVMKV